MNAAGYKILIIFIFCISVILFLSVESTALTFEEFIENIADSALESSFDYKILREEYFQSKTGYIQKNREFYPKFSAMSGADYKRDERSLGSSNYDELDYATDKTKSKRINSGLNIDKIFKDGTSVNFQAKAGSSKFTSEIYEPANSAYSEFGIKISKNFNKDSRENRELKKIKLKLDFDYYSLLEKTNNLKRTIFTELKEIIKFKIKHSQLKSDYKDIQILYGANSDKYSAGIIKKADLMKIKIRLNETEAAINEAESEFKNSIESFKKKYSGITISDNDLEGIESGVIPDTNPADALENFDIESLPELKKLRIQKKIIDIDKTIDFDKFKPDLIISNGYTLINSSKSFESVFDKYDKRWNISFLYNIPIDIFKLKKLTETQYSSIYKLYEFAYSKAKTELEIVLTETAVGLKSLFENIKCLKKNLILYDEILVINKNLYGEGFIPIDNLLSSELEHRRFLITIKQAEIEILTAKKIYELMINPEK
ncbi:MAG TPA: TolC family protein [bacterium]|nr:TolC family protein [bacterium]HPN31791.1 TolC family protein [bacterium]